MNEPLIVERVYHASVKTVWNAITNADEMKKWYFDLPGFKAEVGYEFQFMGGPPEKEYKHLCKVTEAVPEKRLTYSWRYDEYAGNSFVTFELFSEGDKTRLKLTHIGLDSFPKENPDFAKKNFEAGWNSIIGESLKSYLEQHNQPAHL
jgi:uncharacterized protein YndB with AHSA1/START domain